jgi:hypothetical protein
MMPLWLPTLLWLSSLLLVRAAPLPSTLTEEQFKSSGDKEDNADVKVAIFSGYSHVSGKTDQETKEIGLIDLNVKQPITYQSY